ncbi:MAG: NAD-binding protein [Calothrix sp. MO_167.B12]|nr:NAD-binding protein [Calothrix sp. MO_167.B12]
MQPGAKRIYQPVTPIQSGLNNFLVCGLGSLGQYCAKILKEFDVNVRAIDKIEPGNWEIPELPDLLDTLVIGDCRQAQVLERAKVKHCQVILLVTDDEQVNIQAAFAARLLNPQIRLVIRSGKQNLNQLLSQNLGNFVAFEPSQLAANAFALAALGNETLACFSLDNELIQVIQRQIQPEEPWYYQRHIFELNTHLRRVLNYYPANTDPQLTSEFYQWHPQQRLQGGDTLVYIERGKDLAIQKPAATANSQRRQLSWKKIARHLSWHSCKQKLIQCWQRIDLHPSLRIVIVCGVTISCLGITGILIYLLSYPGVNFIDAFHTTASLLLGGYGDVFGGVKLNEPIPLWLHLFSLGLALVGTALIGVMYALFTENLLSARFQFLTRRPSIPKQNHVVVIGLGRLGQGIARFLQEFKQPLVGIDNRELDQHILPQMPLIIGESINALSKVNLNHARSIIVATNNQMINLEIGLIAHNASPQAGLVIRMLERNFSETLGQLLPFAKVLCTEVLAAEAFVAAAFGENILHLFHAHNQTVLVTEYKIAADDTLNKLLLADVAYGYGVVPILYQKSSQQISKWMPSDDIKLKVGDRLVVLANIEGLKRIEQGTLASRPWLLQVEKGNAINSSFEGVRTIARISGCSLAMATKVMEELPAILPKPLYNHQAQRLVRELAQVRVTAHLLPVEE